MKRKIILIVLILAVILTGCGLQDSAPNEIGLKYSGGVTENRKYVGLLQPGANNDSVGFGTEVYKYRTDQRTFIFAKTVKEYEQSLDQDVNQRAVDAPPLECVSKDNIRLTIPGGMYFTLKWGDEDTLRQFHEKLGFKTQAWTSDGWSAALDQYFKPAALRAAESACLKHGWRDLYTSEDTRQAFARDTVTSFQRLLKNLVGGNYFCGPKYTGKNECDDMTFAIGKPKPPQKIVDAIEETERAKESATAQLQENLRIQNQVLGEQRLVDLYGARTAAWIKIMQEAIKDGRIRVMTVPNDAAVAVNSE